MSGLQDLMVSFLTLREIREIGKEQFSALTGNDKDVDVLYHCDCLDVDRKIAAEIRLGLTEIVKGEYEQLSEYNKDVYQRNFLYIAAKAQRYDIVDYFIALGAKFDAWNNWVLVKYLAEIGDTRLLDVIIKQDKKVITTTPLDTAIKNRQYNVVHFFIESQRVEEKVPIEVFRRAIQPAVKYGDEMLINRFLAESGNSTVVVNAAFVAAVYSQNNELIQRFIKLGATDWINAAYAAATMRDINTFSFCLDKFTPNSGELRKMMYNVLFHDGTSVIVNPDSQIVHCIMSWGFDDYNYGLLNASYFNNVAMMDFFYDNGADDVNNAVEYAIINASIDALLWCGKHGVDVSEYITRDKTGKFVFRGEY